MTFTEKYAEILFDKRNRISSMLSRNRIYPELVKDAWQLTSNFDQSISTGDRIFCLAHNISEWGKCEVCEKPSLRSGTSFRPFCSVKCSRTPGCSTFQKAQLTCLERYGVKSNLVTKDAFDKKLAEGGIGCRNPKTLEKVKKTNLARYGFENVFQNTSIKNKIKETHNKKYGGNYHTMKLGNKIKMLEDFEYCKDLAKNHCMTSISEIIGVASNTVYKYFEKHGITNFNRQRSHMEQQVFFFLQEIGISNIIQGDRKKIAPYEIDVFAPDYSLGIELNGLYWHSEKSGCTPTYHAKKTEMARTIGVRLVHIFENEWVLQQDIVKSRLRSIFGKSNKIHARKCKIISVDNKTKVRFLNANHIQGDCASSINIGLQLDGQLIALATFGKSRFDKDIDFELLRFCSILNTTVVGGFSKILSSFKKHQPGTIVSFADTRWSVGDIYSKNGFYYVGKTKPAYHYFFKSSLVLEGRQKYQKHKLKSILPEFQASKSEWQNMKLAGYNRIWDCGTTKWVLI